MNLGYIRLEGAIPELEGIYWTSYRSVRIGRTKDMDVILDDSSVSRAHAEITCTPDGWKIRDLHSTNGTFVNGERVDDEGQKLESGDFIRCGRIVLFAAEVVDWLPTHLAGIERRRGIGRGLQKQ